MFKEEGGARSAGSKSCLRRIAIAALALAAVYSLYMAWVLHYPAVRGVVVDQSTGLPIPGAEVYKAAQGSVFPQESDHVVMGGTGNRAVPAEGTFSFRGGVASRWGFFWPLQRVDRVVLWVYAKDYIPIKLSQVNDLTSESIKGSVYGTSFKRDGDWEVFPGPNGTFRRKRAFLRGWTYRVEMIKANSQEQWEAKCKATLQFRSDNPSGGDTQHPEDQWVFQDLIKYLEKWPKADKAWGYFNALTPTAPLGSCDFLREEMASGRLSIAQLQLYYDRTLKILALAEQVPMPAEGIAAATLQISIKDRRDAVLCAKKLLEEKKHRGERP